MSSETQNNLIEPDLEAIQKANPGLNLTEFLAALRNGGKQAILKITETGEAIEFKVVVNETGLWIKAHPIKASLISVSAVTCLVPAAATGPLFVLLGFGANGPVAGGAAALFQSVFGQVAARGVFATLQSAAMGGYGVAVVNGAVSVVSAGTGILTGLWNHNKKAEDTLVETRSDKDESDREAEKNKRGIDTSGVGNLEARENSVVSVELL